MRDFPEEPEVRAYPTIEGNGAAGEAQWRITRYTGNCCENYLTATASGRLVDFGGTYLRFTDDRGLSWKQVNPIQPFVGGEGAVSAAPGGDIVGIAWDVYSGDTLVAFKFEASTGRWLHLPNKLHTPFFDRPWLSVIPGPLTLLGESVPYAVVIRGGVFQNDLAYVSKDGLTFTSVATPSLSAALGAGTLEDLQPDPGLDVWQPHTEGRITPLPGGGAVIRGGALGCIWSRLGPEGAWSCLDWPADTARVLADGSGRLHRLSSGPDSLAYEVSADGGKTWTAPAELVLPNGLVIEDWDFKVHSALGLSAIAVHAHDPVTGFDQDVVLQLSVAGPVPELERTLFLGLGDLELGSGLTHDGPRFDFSTLAILPDGKLAVSFADAEFHPPAVAIEL